jgi:hypothetical protein
MVKKKVKKRKVKMGLQHGANTGVVCSGAMCHEEKVA